MTTYYVDPAIAANSGSGTSGSPYGDLQYALNTITRDATNGDIIYIKAGTAEVLTAALSLATYGTPTLSVPLSLRGYTSVAEDGGQAEISGAGTYSICTATPDGLSYGNLRMGNCGAAVILNLGRFGGLYNCDLHTTTGNGVVGNADCSPIVNCVIRGVSGVGVSNSIVHNCLFLCESGRNFSSATTSDNVTDSCFYLTGSSNGINSGSGTGCVMRNSLLSVSPSGGSMGISRSRPIRAAMCAGNIIEGFITGITLTSSTESGFGVLHNACYGNTTNYASAFGKSLLVNLDNETLGSTPFAKSGAVTWANRATYFALNNVGSVRDGLFGFQSKGAIPFSGGLSKPSHPFLQQVIG
jgi:hypothetical protein